MRSLTWILMQSEPMLLEGKTKKQAQDTEHAIIFLNEALCLKLTQSSFEATSYYYCCSTSAKP